MKRILFLGAAFASPFLKSLTSLLILPLLLMPLPASATIETNRNYEGVVNALQGLQKAYPKVVRSFTLGTSDAGIPIYGVQIGTGPTQHLVVATHHGNEFASTEVAINFAESVAKNPLPGQTIFIIPVLNIEGYNRRNRYEQVKGAALDLNRDYPGPCGTEGPYFSRSTKALADFVQSSGVVAVATLHTYKPAVVYPWGVSTEDVVTPYTPIFEVLAKAATTESHYETGYSTEVMYPADGTFEDYAFWKHGIYSLLFEIGGSNDPTPEDLNFAVHSNVTGLREMLLAALKNRAPNHDFTGKCSARLRRLDRHRE